ncbi:hypothetical protein [Streptomyces niveus]|uniref:hypothetical protein n=1 Tax=Streptomyces niveus TaxID=193462 RepID=UPI003433470B
MKLTELIARAETVLVEHGDLDVGIPDDGCALCRPDDAEPYFGDCADTAAGMTSGYPLRQDRRVLPGGRHPRIAPDVGVTFEDNS